MKTRKLILLALAILAMSFKLTDSERKYAANLLQETKQDLLKKVKGLTPEQLNFKPSADSWSIAECVEHLAISENNFNEFRQISLKTPPDPSKRSEVKMTDEAILKMITDRSSKFKTSGKFQPSGKFGSFEASLTEFKTKRNENIQYIKTTSDDLRNHYHDFPFGKLDVYQTMIFMAGHSRRHTDQIEEVMNHPDFPKKKK